MLPYHSITISASLRADIKNLEIKKLTERIIKIQNKEILEMRTMKTRLKNNKKI